MEQHDIAGAVIAYLLFVGALLVMRPRLLFEKDPEYGGNGLTLRLRRFGLGPDKTLFSFGVITIVLAVGIAVVVFSNNSNGSETVRQ